jgi:hypothetical protein
VDLPATSDNIPGTLVLRDSSGSFSSGNSGGASEVVKTVGSAAIDLSSGNAQTIASFSLPDIGAGDIVEVTLQTAELNNSGSSKTFTYNFTIDGVAVLPGWNSDSLFNNANRRLASILFKTAIVSSASFVSNCWGHFSNTVAKNTNSNVGSNSQHKMSYNDGSDNLTGTKTVALTVQSSASGSNQEIGPVITVFRHIKGV